MRSSIKLTFSAQGLVLVMLALINSGCNSGNLPPVAEGRTRPKGRILENGLPIKIRTQNLPPGDPGMKVTFVKIGTADAGEEIDAQIIDAAEGSFELIGPDAKGIPPGKYRVLIFMAPEGGIDHFKGKYSRNNSPIEVEIKPDEDLVIDIAKFK